MKKRKPDEYEEMTRQIDDLVLGIQAAAATDDAVVVLEGDDTKILELLLWRFIDKAKQRRGIK